MTQRTVRYKEWTCRVVLGVYSNGRVAIQLFDATDGELVTTATVNLPDARMAAGETAVKDWSENTGMLAFLVSEGIVEDTGRREPTGFVAAPIVRVKPVL